jgi:hypothetical protein
LEAAMRDVLDPWMNPVTYAIPFFLLFIGIELAALKWLEHDDVTGYQAKDASTSILMGVGSRPRCGRSGIPGSTSSSGCRCR